MAMVDVDDRVPIFGGLTAQVDWLGLELMATWHSVYIHE